MFSACLLRKLKVCISLSLSDTEVDVLIRIITIVWDACILQ